MIGHLQEKGFAIAQGSNANYSTTALSLAATLNLNYVHDLVGTEIDWLADWRLARELITKNKVGAFLRQQGYSIVAFPSLFYNSRWGEADVYLSRWWFLNDFEMGLIGMTPIPWTLRKFCWPVLEDLHRAMTLHTIDRLPEIAQWQGPKFIYAHLLCPHPPFVFGPNGESVNPKRRYQWVDSAAFQRTKGASKEEYIDGYRSQVQFIGARISSVIDRILETSASPPIIVLQGDHGPAVGPWIWDRRHASVRERFGILNALYLPQGDADAVYDTMSPVNTFRLIFNSYFGTHYDLLDDRSYYVLTGRPYKIIPQLLPPPA